VKLDQVERELEVLNNKRYERITTGIANLLDNLRSENSSLCPKLSDTLEAKEDIETEIDTTCFQLVGTSIAKKKPDQELAMEPEKGESANLQADAVNKDAKNKITDRPVEDCNDKENTKPKATKRDLLKSRKVAVARRHLKKPLTLATGQQV